MKTKIDRMKHRAKSTSKRTLALLMSLVMLVTAVGVSTMMTAFAVTVNPTEDALSETVAPADETSAPDDADENAFIKDVKDELAVTGADADLTKTGDTTTYYVCYNLNNSSAPNNLTSSNQMKSIGDYYWGEIPSNGTQFYFGISDSSTFVGHSQLGSGRNATKDSNGVINQVGNQPYTYSGTEYYYCYGHTTSAATVYVRWDGSNDVYLTTSKPAGYDDAGGGGGGGGGSDSGQNTGTVVNDADLIAVLLNQKIMFYYGVNWSTNNLWMYHGTFVSGTVSNTIDASTDSTSTINGVTSVAKGCAAIDSSTTYYITSDNTWAGNNVKNNYPTAGQLYYLESSTNTPNVKTSNVTITWDTGCDSDAITADTNSTIISATSSGKTGGNSDVSTKYYYTTDESPTVSSTFKEFNPSDLGGGLAPGTYYIYAAAKDSNNVYIAASGPATLTVHPRLDTPVITLDTATDDNTSSQTASTTAKSTVTVTNVNSYNVGTVFTLYKGDTSIASNTTGVFSIARNTNTAGVYKVIASPGASDTTLSDSLASNTPTLGISLQDPPDDPVISISPSVINQGGKVTITISNFEDFDLTTHKLQLYKFTDGNTTIAAGSITGKKGTFTDPSTLDISLKTTDAFSASKQYTHYKVVAEALDDTVYSDSGASNVADVRNVPAAWKTFGDSPFGDGNIDSASGTVSIDSYYGGDTFYHVYSDCTAATTYNFKLYSTNTYWANPSEDTDVTTNYSEASPYEATFGNGGKKFQVTGYDTYVLFLKQDSSSSPGTNKPSIWVRTDMSPVTVTPKYQTMDLSTGNYNTAETDDGSRITANIDSTVVENGSTLTLTAMVNDSDYEFIGWYDDNDFTGEPLSPKLTYTTEAISSSKTYYPLVREKVNKHDVIVEKNDTASVSAEWHDRTAKNGRTLSNVPVGATVILSATANSGYSIDTIKWDNGHGNSGTVSSGGTFTMPDGNVTVTVKTKPSFYLWYKTGVDDANPDTGGWSCLTDADYEYRNNKVYIKIPTTVFSGTNNTIFAMSNSKTALYKQIWFENESSINVGFLDGDSTSTNYLTLDKNYYWDGDKHWYARVKFKDADDIADSDYVLLEAYGANHDYKFSLVSSDNPARVNFIAKDGATRGDTAGATNVDNDQKTLGAIGSTKVYLATDTTNKTAIGSQSTYTTYKDSAVNQYYTGSLSVGTEYTISTTVSDSRYYVKAFNVNGVSVSVLDKPASAAAREYTCNYTVPADATGTLEIIPVYYLYDDSSCVNFYLEGYDETIQNDLDWGNTPYIYPFYATQTGASSGGSDRGHNSLGAYPGQPMIYANGQYEIQIAVENVDLCTPTGDSSETGTNIKGITINNGYFDPKHKDLLGWSGDEDHKQTYDFDDFHKIYEEKNPTNIYFKMKLREDRDNSATYRHTLDTDLTSVNIADIRDNGNGWELLQDRFNRTIDIFGNPLSGEALEADPLYVISTGYNANTAGSYGTSWQVYHKNGNSYSLVRDTTNNVNAIPPSLLFVNTAANLAKSVYPTNNYTSDYVNSTQILPGIYGDPESYSTLYTTLKNSYSGVPVYLSYEMNDRTTPSNYGGSGDTTYGAWRLDGRWYYTTAGDLITSNIEIQYLDNASGYKTEESYVTGYDGEANQGAHTGAQAYFKDTDYDYYAKRITDSVPLDKTKSFSMEATPADGYEFVGWYVKSDNTYTAMNPLNVSSVTATTARSAGFTFVARYRKLSSGNLSITNTATTGTALSGTTFNGAGTAALKIEITTDGTTYKPLADGVTSYKLGGDYLNDTNLAHDYFKLKVTASGTRKGNDAFGEIDNIYNSRYSTTSPYEYEIQLNKLFTAVDDGSGGYEYDQTVFSLPFKTYFTAHEYKYEITYSYPSTRLSSGSTPITQSYTAYGTIKSSQLDSVTETVSGTANAKLTDQFVIDKKPKESNFMKDMTFSVDAGGFERIETTAALTTFKATAAYTIDDTNSGKMSVSLNLPYAVTSRTKGDYNFTATADPATYDNTFANVNFTVAQGYGNYLSSTGTKATTASGLLTAPEKVIKTEEEVGNTYFFSYWLVSDSSGSELFKVYNREFNYRLYNNCTIEPVFNSVAEETHGLADDYKLVSIEYLGTTRNQWNNSQNGGYVAGSDAQDIASDILFNDFEVAYTYKAKELAADADATCGVILQKVGTVEEDSNGDKIVDMEYYASKYADTESSHADLIKTFITSNNKGGLILQKYDNLRGNLNNKNRMDFYYGSYNSYGWNSTTNTPATNRTTIKQNVYRAYSYMTYSGDENVYLSEPVYFSMYEAAN